MSEYNVGDKGTLRKVTSNDRGKHSELLAQTALLAHGYSVLEPIVAQTYDLAARDPDTQDTTYFQVKTAFLRSEERYGGDYLVVKGARNNGKVYTKDEVDMFIAVWDNECYMFPNRECSEYWIRPKDLEKKWIKLETELKR